MATLSLGAVTVEPLTQTLSVGVVEVVPTSGEASWLSVGVVEVVAAPLLVDDSGAWLCVAPDVLSPRNLWIDVPGYGDATYGEGPYGEGNYGG